MRGAFVSCQTHSATAFGQHSPPSLFGNPGLELALPLASKPWPARGEVASHSSPYAFSEFLVGANSSQLGTEFSGSTFYGAASSGVSSVGIYYARLGIAAPVL